MLRFATDEDFNWNIIHGLRQRNPDVDIATVQERGLYGRPDTQILEWAASEQRILLSHDVNTMRGLAHDRIGRGEMTPGVIMVLKTVPIGQAIDTLELLAVASSASEWANLVEYLPRL